MPVESIHEKAIEHMPAVSQAPNQSKLAQPVFEPQPDLLDPQTKGQSGGDPNKRVGVFIKRRTFKATMHQQGWCVRSSGFSPKESNLLHRIQDSIQTPTCFPEGSSKNQANKGFRPWRKQVLKKRRKRLAACFTSSPRPSPPGFLVTRAGASKTAPKTIRLASMCR